MRNTFLIQTHLSRTDFLSDDIQLLDVLQLFQL
jgi:hypothetical protein